MKTTKFLGIYSDNILGSEIIEKNFDNLITDQILIVNNMVEETEPKLRISYDYKEVSYTINPEFLNEIYDSIKEYVESLNNESIDWRNIGLSFDLIDFQQKVNSLIDVETKKTMLINCNKQLNISYMNFTLEEENYKYVKLKKSLPPMSLSNLFDFKRVDKLLDQREYILKMDELSTYPMRRLYHSFLCEGMEWREWVFRRIDKSNLIHEYLTHDFSYSDKLEYAFLVDFEEFDLINIWGNFICFKKADIFIKSELSLLIKSTKEIEKSDSKPDHLSELLTNKKTFDELIRQLIDKNIVKINNSNYYVVIPSKYKKHGFQMFTCAIGLSLDNKGYLKSCNNTDIVRVLNNLFENSKVSKQDYDNLLNSKNQSTYLAYTSFL